MPRTSHSISSQGFLDRIRKRLGAPDLDFPKPPFQEGEVELLEGAVFFAKSLFNSKSGRLILTNRRLLWDASTDDIWPFKRITGRLDLADIASVDKGTLLDLVFGGRRLRLRLVDGRDKCLWDAEGKLDEWIASIRSSLPGTST
jgi:hypothetical protein